MVFSTDNNVLRLSVDSRLYSESVVYKCFYWYTGEYDVSILASGNNYEVQLIKKDGGAVSIDIESKIQRDLIDFKLRQIVSEETKQIRELITAKAFAYYDVDTSDVGVISDPVGFDVNKIV